jgi:hypothetical protein
VYDKLRALWQLAELLGYLRDQPPAPPNDRQQDVPVMTDDELS